MHEAKQRLHEIYHEIGEQCPYLAAKHIGIHVSSKEQPADLCGWYFSYDNSIVNHRRILINSTLSGEDQEKVCERLVLHHIAFDGYQYLMNKKELEGGNKVTIHLFKEARDLVRREISKFHTGGLHQRA